MKKQSLSVLGLCFLLMVGFPWELGAFDEDDLEKLGSTNKCSKCDLTGADLHGANLSKAKLTRVNLSGADLTGTDLRNANLFGAKLTGANLTGADLSGANLLGTKLSGIQIDEQAISTNKILIIWKTKEEAKKQTEKLQEEVEIQLVKGVDAVVAAGLPSTLDDLIVNFRAITIRLDKLEQLFSRLNKLDELFARLDELEDAVEKLEANTQE